MEIADAIAVLRKEHKNRTQKLRGDKRSLEQGVRFAAINESVLWLGVGSFGPVTKVSRVRFQTTRKRSAMTYQRVRLGLLYASGCFAM
jgi:hypothetical protein